MTGHFTRVAGALLLGAALACGGGDTATTDTGATTGGTPTIGAAPGGGDAAMSDSNVFAALVTANAAEIMAGQLAADSATNPQVKQFAQMMVTDHRAMNEQAHQAAQQANIASHAGERAEDIGETGRELMQDLEGKRGAEFDRTYMDGMVRSHEETLELLNRATQNTNLQAPIRNVVTQSQQKVQQHLEQARQIQQQLQQGS